MHFNCIRVISASNRQERIVREKMKNLVSIIIPVYNVAKYLPECIESCIKQTYENIEIILVDDGSTDNSGDICDAFAKQDKRIIVVHKDNEGVNKARETGLKKSTGQYIMFLDSDDYFAFDAVDYMLSMIEGNDVALAIASDQAVSETGEIIGDDCGVSFDNKEEVISEREFWIRRNKNTRCVVFVTKIYRRELLEEMDFVEYKKNEDQASLLKIIPRCDGIAYSDKVIYYYRQREDSCIHGPFDADDLSLAEVMLDEMKYFRERCWTDLEVEAFGKGTRRVRDGYRMLDGSVKATKTLLKGLYGRYREEAKIILHEKVSFRTRARMCLFLMSRRVYFAMSLVGK